ncbi:hypothetical protein PQX77_010231 [Marasmius sp. AFHP31]|nr:hypothetical protein PQX77_010231 [Marasmius sp. AFHP31]
MSFVFSFSLQLNITQFPGYSDLFWQPRSFIPHDDKTSSSVMYTEFCAPNSPPSTTIGETEARLFAQVLLHPVYGGRVLWIEKDAVGWARRRWLKGKRGRGRVLSGDTRRNRLEEEAVKHLRRPPNLLPPPLSQSVTTVTHLRPKALLEVHDKPPRPLTKAQQERQLQDGEAGIDADATKADNEILKEEARELKKKLEKLEADVRELKEDLVAQRRK